MKRCLCFFICFFVFINGVSAKEKLPVKFNKCTDGDTAKVILNDEVISIRFLAIDTPETNHPTKGVESYGKEASVFTCNSLETADNILIEYDDNSDKLDKYDRHLVWVYVDGLLLQNLLVKEGLAKVAYLYGDYQYTDILKSSERIAKDNKIGVWSDEETNCTEILLIIFSLITIVIMFIFSSKYRKKSINKVKRKISKKIKNLIT